MQNVKDQILLLFNGKPLSSNMIFEMIPLKLTVIWVELRNMVKEGKIRVVAKDGRQNLYLPTNQAFRDMDDIESLKILSIRLDKQIIAKKNLLANMEKREKSLDKEVKAKETYRDILNATIEKLEKERANLRVDQPKTTEIDPSARISQEIKAANARILNNFQHR